MILVDANLLVYARDSSSPFHAAALSWLDGQINGSRRIAIPWPSVLAYLRIVTNRRIYANADSMTVAWKTVTDWLALPNVWVPMPGDRHQAILAQLLPYAAADPNLVPDAHLAALAIEHGLILCTVDRDFARFPDLRWQNPLQPAPPHRKRPR